MVIALANAASTTGQTCSLSGSIVFQPCIKRCGIEKKNDARSVQIAVIGPLYTNQLRRTQGRDIKAL